MLSDLPRFIAARRYALVLILLGATCFGISALLLWLELSRIGLSWISYAVLPKSIGYLGISFLSPAAGFFASGMMAFARQQALALETNQTRQPAPRHTRKEKARFGAFLSLWSRYWPQWRPDLMSLLEWSQTILVTVLSVGAIGAVLWVWRETSTLPEPFAIKSLAGLLVICAFPLLVMERVFANMSPELLPEAPSLNRLVRLPLTVAIISATGLAFASAGFAWTNVLDSIVALLITAIAVELLLRALATMFVPSAPLIEKRSIADSRIAGSVLRVGLPTIQAINLTVRRQLGIDLSRSWALAFVQKALLPVVAGIVLFAWIITGFTSLAVNQRGVYERFGVPVEIFHPGLNVHLPWPLGIVRPIEVGVIHQLPIEFLLPGGNGKTVAEPPDATVKAEDIPPPSADRLWDDAHPFEGSYLIASEENGRQSFQLVDVDMAVVYQIGLSDDAARDAAYRVTDPDELIQALSGQILVEYLSHNTLLDLLGKSRESFATEFQAALQKELNQFSAGIDVLAISIEAIHPPPGAAGSYHNVQASEIGAQTEVSTSRSGASRSMGLAQIDATHFQNEALTAAAELVGRAQGAAVRFEGDRKAYAKDGTPFLLERWFSNLTAAVAKGEAIIIDHRLRGQDALTIDLRPTSGASAPETPTFPFPQDNSRTPAYSRTAPSDEE